MKEELKKYLTLIDLNDEKYQRAGIPFIKEGEQIWLDDTDTNNLIVGINGSGKTKSLLLPLIKLLIKNGESMIIVDPKEEYYCQNIDLLKQANYKVRILNLANPDEGNAWNPFSLPYYFYCQGNIDKAIELLEDISSVIFYNEDFSCDPFWDNTAADFFVGLSLSLFKDAKKEAINFNSIQSMVVLGKKIYKDADYLKAYFDLKDPSDPAYLAAAPTVYAPSQTKDSLLSVFLHKIKGYGLTERLSNMMSVTDFDFNNIGNEKTAFFLFPKYDKSFVNALAVMFLKQSYIVLRNQALENKGKLPIRMNFILDHFDNLPPLKEIDQIMRMANNYHIRFNLVINYLQSLDYSYGEEISNKIKLSCHTKFYFLNDDTLLKEDNVILKEASKLSIGEVIIKKQGLDLYKTVMSSISDYPFDVKKEIKVIYPKHGEKLKGIFNIEKFIKGIKNKN